MPTVPKRVSDKYYQASNYWVDVVFNGSPRASRRWPTMTAGSLRHEHHDVDSGLGPACQRHGPQWAAAVDHGGEQSEHGTATYNSSTQTINFVPTTGYIGPAGFTYTISDGQGTASANVALTVVTSATNPVRHRTPTCLPKIRAAGGSASNSVHRGGITALRFYRSASDTGTNVVDLWTSTGACSPARPSQQRRQRLADGGPPDAGFVAAGTTYIASYHTNGAFTRPATTSPP